jgi:hypothetical protein
MNNTQPHLLHTTLRSFTRLQVPWGTLVWDLPADEAKRRWVVMARGIKRKTDFRKVGVWDPLCELVRLAYVWFLRCDCLGGTSDVSEATSSS